MFAELCVLGMECKGGAKEGTEDIAVVIVPKEHLREQYSQEELEKVIRADVKRLSQKLASYKRPINIIVTDKTLPRTATRKIQRKKVKELILA